MGPKLCLLLESVGAYLNDLDDAERGESILADQPPRQSTLISPRRVRWGTQSHGETKRVWSLR